MRNLRKCAALFLTAFTSVIILAGCSAPFDVAGFVRGNMDVIYLNKISESFLEMVEDTEEELAAFFVEGLASEAESLFYFFDIVEEMIPYKMKDETIELLREIYGHSKYEIGNVTRAGDVFLVSVTIYPIDIIHRVAEEDIDVFIESWSERWDRGEFDEVTDEEFETLWARGILDLIHARLGSIGHLEPETISVQVVIDSDNYYTISENDWIRIDNLIMLY